MDNIISNREDMIKAWIDYKKTYDKVNHSWILESLELVQVSDNICEFVKISMANWQTELTACKESLAKVNIRRGIFQGDSLSPLLFAICMILQLTYYAKPEQGIPWEEEIKLTIFCLWTT